MSFRFDRIVLGLGDGEDGLEIRFAAGFGSGTDFFCRLSVVNQSRRCRFFVEELATVALFSSRTKFGRCEVGESIIAIFRGEKSSFLGDVLAVDGAALFLGDTTIFAGEHGKLRCNDGASSLEVCRLEILIAAN